LLQSSLPTASTGASTAPFGAFEFLWLTSYVHGHGCCGFSILYQRGIYPPESFASANQYGLTMMVSTDEGLKKYLAQVLTQLSSMCGGTEVAACSLAGHSPRGVCTQAGFRRAPCRSWWSSSPASTRATFLSAGYLTSKQTSL